MPGAFKLLFCFQDACPGCHSAGFPSLIKLVEGLRGSRMVSFAAVQTAFEDFEHNSYERIDRARAVISDATVIRPTSPTESP